MSDLGTRTKTLRSSRLLISSRPPAIQYSRSGDFKASAQEGSSSASSEGVMLPSERAARISGIERVVSRCSSAGRRS
jgi:hypothetical protein